MVGGLGKRKGAEETCPASHSALDVWICNMMHNRKKLSQPASVGQIGLTSETNEFTIVKKINRIQVLGLSLVDLRVGQRASPIKDIAPSKT